MADTTGQADLRAEVVERIVKGFALQEFVMKQVCMISTAGGWQESYYRETATELTGGLGSAVKGIPRLANFPYGEPSWTKVSAYIEKYGMEGIVSFEDEKANNIDVIARTLLRIARAVANAVDSQIYAALSTAAGNTSALTAGYEWDSATVANRDPMGDFATAQKLIAEDNFNAYTNAFLLLNPKDFSNCVKNDKFERSLTGSTAVRNGAVGSLKNGLKVLVSPVITADEAMIVIGGECVTWKQATPLSVVTINDPGVKKTIRAYELGVAQVTTPNACCKMTNTAA